MDSPITLTGQPRYERMAPGWHTAVFIVIAMLVSLSTAKSQHSMARQHHLVTYGMTMAWEWVLLLYCWWGMRKAGVRLRDVIGGRWATVEDMLLDVGLAAGSWIVFALILVGIGAALGLTGKSNIEESRKSLEFLIPRTGVEVAIWIALSATAGFCEEIVFRGYLQRQLASFTQNIFAGIVLSAVVFGFSHGYEGPARMVMVFVLGAMLGLLAHWRKSLRPSMIVHTWQDALAGIALRFLK